MRLAYECTAMCEARPSGIGRYARHLLNALAALATNKDLAISAWYRRSYRKNAHHAAPPAGIPLRAYQDRLWPLWGPCDVLHGSAHRTPHWYGCARVVSIMDLTPFLNPGGLAPAQLVRDQESLRHAASHCHAFIAISAATRDDAVRILDLDPGRIVVTHLGVAGDFRPHTEEEITPVLMRLGLPRRFLLHVGDLHPRKNLVRLVEAFANCRDAAGLPLVLAGRPAGADTEIQAAVTKHGLGDRVKLVSYVSETDLPILYAAALGLCYPTLYEGFGFPIIEALRSGTPVMTSNISSCPEVAGNHAQLVDPTDVGSIRDGITALLQADPSRQMAARLWADGFTWERCARQTLDAYRLAMAHR